jgi:hypothetical protein
MIATLVALSACGGGDKEKQKPVAAIGGPEAPAEGAAAGAGGPQEVGDFIILGETKMFKPIEKLFGDYQKREITAVANPMLSNITDFIERPVAARKDLGAEESATAEGDKVVHCADIKPGTPEYDRTPPLEREPLTRYALAMLMTGRSDPIAMVTDPQGEQYSVRRGDRIGCEGGHVQDILQYSMFIQKPGEPKPVEWSIAPPLSRVQQKAEEQSEDL